MALIRDMRPDDLPAVGLLAEQLVQQHHGWDTTRFFPPPDVAQGYRRFIASQFGQRATLLLVAEVDGAVAGYLYGTLEPRDWSKLLNEHGAVHDVIVAAAHRRQGLARALLTAAASRFQGLGARQLVLYSASANLEGQALFRQLGFRPTMVELTLDLAGPTGRPG